ncbi:MAG: TonB-dependent receptor [Flavobacterium sp. BFFFF2]|nr:MAG: TonB-dependent receptor [Flavobacterium sp. BFFFF2]
MTQLRLYSIFIFILFLKTGLFAQSNEAVITGVIFDADNHPLSNVQIVVNKRSATSNEAGFYQIRLPANEQVKVVFQHELYKKITANFYLKPGERMEFHPKMDADAEQLSDVVITNSRHRVQGIVTFSPDVVRKIPGANAGVENLLKSLAGVNSNNELSTQYAVRGGNYDENLVYVNEIEIYRPFLIRSGQQEGLSFTNSDMIQNLEFSAGGFQAKYGDKLSSVLDITYRKPTKRALALDASFLGGSLTWDAITKNKKTSVVLGARYRDNSLLVNSQQTQTNYRPRFLDVQTYINHSFNDHWQLGFLGNISQNRYSYQPLTRQTNFGTFDNPIALRIFYEGQEQDTYLTYFGASKLTFSPNKQNNYRWTTSIYHTQEQEHYDIDAAYYLGEVDANLGSETFGNVVFSRGVGSQLTHARNNLDALIVNTEIKGTHQIQKKHQIDWGFKYTRENIRDRIVEWETIDSAGFNVNPPTIHIPRDQPYNPFTGPLAPFKSIRATNYSNINRLSGFAQWNVRGNWGNHAYWLTAGVRAQYWQVMNDVNGVGGGQTVVSPRIQFSFKPGISKDILFRMATGFYYQPPFYRELRDANGQVLPNVKAQKSIHFIAGADYQFQLWNRPFKLVTEAYYKTITDVNTYSIDNVRIRYKADNNAIAYAYGLDVRWNGEFVKGTESWLSVGYMKTEENYNNQGYIARPTDQRVKFALLFQDYMPTIPNLKVYLNLTYNTGLPGGSPSYADAYLYQNRLRDYQRADVGFSYVFTEKNYLRSKDHWMQRFSELSLGFEIFNLFNNQNSITNTWVRDVYTKSEYAVPNYMTTRVFNIRLTARL